MKNTFFKSMKEQMQPDESAILSLRSMICETKKTSKAKKIISWVPSAACAFMAALCILNAAVPQSTEKLPIIGKAFASLNRRGEITRIEGKTPAFLAGNTEKKEKVENAAIDCPGLSIDCAFANGLDLSFELLFCDEDGIFPDEVEYITLSGAFVEFDGEILNPVAEAPRLCEISPGVYSGSSLFDISPIAARLKSGSNMAAILHFDALMGSYDEMPYQRVRELTHSESYYEKLSVEVDISSLLIEHFNIPLGEVTLEYAAATDDRCDMVYSASESVDWVKSYNIYSDAGEPTLITSSLFPSSDGKYYFRSVYTDRSDNEAEIDEDLLSKQMMYKYMDKISVYNEATGETVTYITDGDEYTEFTEEEIE